MCHQCVTGLSNKTSRPSSTTPFNSLTTPCHKTQHNGIIIHYHHHCSGTSGQHRLSAARWHQTCADTIIQHLQEPGGIPLAADEQPRQQRPALRLQSPGRCQFSRGNRCCSGGELLWCCPAAWCCRCAPAQPVTVCICQVLGELDVECSQAASFTQQQCPFHPPPHLLSIP